jgi:aryl-alcohol dehydrogenase-like predicted oxidoreductase
MATTGTIPYRTLGRTGERVSLLGLGGAHLGKIADERESIQIMRTALDNGVNFLDNSWGYHNGASELRMGLALKDGYRQKAFLMTKFDGQTATAATRQFEESLRRLQVDYVDLLQFHEIIRPEDPDRVFAPGGAFEAMQALRQAGKVRYIGFTGHKHPDIHLKMIRTGLAHGFTFDTVQMPINVMDAHFRSFSREVLPVALEHGIGVLAMKPLASSHILRAGVVTAIECLHYAMSLPVSVVITGCDSLPILEQALEAARTFRPLSESEVEALLARTAAAAGEGEYEPFKVTQNYDSTHRNPGLLGLGE